MLNIFRSANSLPFLFSRTHSLKLAISQFIAERLSLITRFSYFSVTNLTLLFGLLFVLPVADVLSILMGGNIDIGELICLSDGLFADFVGASLLSLLLLNPLIVQQLWHLIDSNCKFIHNIDLTHASLFLAPPRLKYLEQTAHGCRAPPL
ncbi:hypothetical protein [Shewanella glacialipiscicola]|uniref:hypothetical protein n=1 Tax=Shewanella glacialipiscicola TaxID=614069 RepID=UPI001FE4C15C|nr:hypothetical protein [Shewanella glacialipiscicola]